MSKRKKRKQALLLHDLACAMQACERAGLDPKFHHGIIVTSIGFILPVKDRWQVRLLRHFK